MCLVIVIKAKYTDLQQFILSPVVQTTNMIYNALKNKCSRSSSGSLI
jgi:hypothetical protein